jgi:hypothetical protein
MRIRPRSLVVKSASDLFRGAADDDSVPDISRNIHIKDAPLPREAALARPAARNTNNVVISGQSFE